MTWAEMKLQELEAKGEANWDNDDWEAYCYCKECQAEDERDAEYIGSFGIVY